MILKKDCLGKVLLSAVSIIFLVILYLHTKENTFKDNITLSNYLLPNKRPEPPPFQCNSTIISAYYKIESKHSFEEYLSWMINFLSLKDCMVIFVQPDLAEIISSLRPPSYPALVIPRPWKSFLVNRILTDQQWMKQEARDNEVSHGHNARLYQVWNEKSNMMKIVADLNPFGSKYFLWLDIGAVRHSKYNHQPLIRNWPKDKGALLLNIQPFTEKERRLEDSVSTADFSNVMRIGGGAIGCDLDSVYKWHSAYYRTFQQYVDRGQFVGKDQNLMASVCVETGMCLLVEVKNPNSDTEWFKLQEWFRGDLPNYYQKLEKLNY